MKFTISLILLSFWVLHPIAAQNWLPVAPGVDRAVGNIYPDPNGSGLYFGGQFKYSDTLEVGGITFWDGNQYHSLDGGQTTFGTGSNSGRAILRYQGDLYSQMNVLAGGVLVNGIAKWDGQSWHAMGLGVTHLPDTNDGVVYGLHHYDGKMLVTGEFQYAGGISASKVALWDGTNWSALDDTKWDLGAVGCAAVYKGDLYIGGNFKNEAKDIWRLARWDGNEWQKVGEGIRGGINSVGALAVYKDELYVAGDFTKEDDSRNPGSNIAKWDGTKWSDVGGGTYADNGSFGGFINDLLVYQDELYAIGAFVSAGGVPAASLAKWDSTQWCGFEAPDLDDGGPISMAIFRDTLYVGGSFKLYGTDTIKYITKLNGPPIVDSCGFLDVGTKDLNNSTRNFSVFPNPTQGVVNYELPDLFSNNGLVHLEIINIQGQVIWQEFINTTNGHLDLGVLGKGSFWLKATGRNQVAVTPLVLN